jgi:hypothetical protein
MYPFGQEIDVQIGESIISEYIDNIEDKKEYLVNFECFIEMAKHYDLELVSSETFDNLYTHDIYDKKGNNNDGNEKFSGLTDEHKQLSFLCRTFVFQKTSNSMLKQKNNLQSEEESFKHMSDLQSKQLKTQTVECIDQSTVYISDTLSTSDALCTLNSKLNHSGQSSGSLNPPVITCKFDEQKYNDVLDHLKHIKRQKVLYFSKEAWNEHVKNIKLN